MTDTPPDLLVFDGVCVLCNGWARFVHQRDRSGSIRFATAQSAAGRAVYLQAGLSPDAMETVLIRLNGRTLQKSDGVLALLSRLGGVWRLLAVSRIVPRPIRDWVYDRIARNRYRLFGRLDACPLPPPGLKDRFVDQGLS
jgi:predicted DCC family thiol-disulfide oxidoreductase YuxK